MRRTSADLSPNGIAPSVASAYDSARQGINYDFGAAKRAENAYVTQGFAQAGGIYNTNQIDDARLAAAQNLEKERRGAMRNLDFQEASAGLNQYNSLLNLLGVGSGTALALSSGSGRDQALAISGLSGTSKAQGALGGAATGASLGSYAGGYGALIGGVLGGLGGYFGSGN